jgi:colanic acid/amylovoran biosynthesis glycosyltransferase
VFAVAHFRRILFIPTETFLYNYLSSFSRIIPVGITFQKANLERFPYSHPMVELYSWDIWNRGWRWLHERIWQEKGELRYDLPKTTKALQQYDVRVLHAHFGYTGSQVLPVKDKTGLPLVTTFYGEDISALARSERWKRGYAELFNQGDFFLVEGPHMQKRLLEIGCLPERAGIQRIALKLDQYTFRQRLPKGKTDTVRLLFCGSFREKKGLLYALDAVRHAHERFPKLEFHIVGDGELRLQVEQTIKQLIFLLVQASQPPTVIAREGRPPQYSRLNRAGYRCCPPIMRIYQMWLCLGRVHY